MFGNHASIPPHRPDSTRRSLRFGFRFLAEQGDHAAAVVLVLLGPLQQLLTQLFVGRLGRRRLSLVVRGRPLTPDEEAAYVREVAESKTSALRMSLDAVDRQGMPFVGEEKGMAPGQGMGSVPGDRR